MKARLVHLSLASAALPTMALAQAAPPAAASNGTTGLQDIVVTAQKRAEKLSTVPISVSVLSNEDMFKKGITSTKDLEFTTPSLVTNELASFSQIYLRGVGTDLQSPGAEGGVASYIDGVYAPFTSSELTGLLGIERTEVLYGPQGTLYGRNAVGGAINTITLTPGQTWHDMLSASYGNYNAMQANGYVSGPVSDTLAIGVYGAISRRHTFLHYLPSVPDGTARHENEAAGRIKAVWTPNDDWKIIGTVEYARIRGVEAQAFRQLVPTAPGYLLNPDLPPIKFGDITGDYPTYEHVKSFRSVLEIDKDFGWSNLVSLSAYQAASTHGSLDVDGTSTPLVGSRQNTPHMRDYSQELRLQSRNGAKISWVAGLYYAHNVNGYDPDVTVLETYASPISPTYFENNVITRIQGDSYAAFGQVTVPIVTNVSLTAGLRYSTDKKKAYDNAVFGQNPETGAISGYTTFPDDRHSWHAWTPKATLTYKVPGFLAYVTYSKGYKSGQYPPANPASIATDGPVNPEKLTDIEGGIKASIGNRFNININAFHYDYKDLQVYFVRLIDGVLTPTLQNAAKAEIYGGDVSINALLFRGFTVGGSVAYNHSEYTSFPNFGGTVQVPGGGVAQVVNATGNPVQRDPKWTTSFNAAYDHKFDDGSDMFATVLWSHNSGFSWDPSNFYRQKPYDVVNATIGYTLPGNKITISGWAKNLNDAHYERIEFPYALGLFGTDATPRTYGLTVTFKD